MSSESHREATKTEHLTSSNVEFLSPPGRYNSGLGDVHVINFILGDVLPDHRASSSTSWNRFASASCVYQPCLLLDALYQILIKHFILRFGRVEYMYQKLGQGQGGLYNSDEKGLAPIQWSSQKIWLKPSSCRSTLHEHCPCSKTVKTIYRGIHAENHHSHIK